MLTLSPAPAKRPAPGTRYTPIFRTVPMTYPQGMFAMTEEERAQHESNMRARESRP